MKNYIPVSKKSLDERLNQIIDTEIQVANIVKVLKSVEDLVGFNSDEEQALKDAKVILLNKLEKLEDILEDENNQFYNSESINEIW